MRRSLVVVMVFACSVWISFSSCHAQNPFVQWETPHVHPLERTPDGQYLLAVNTAGASLEVFALTSGTPVWEASIPVGIDPVSVRTRSNGEAWVINHISDSISVVDLATRRVRRTIRTNDEPCDVVFAGAALNAFVSCSQVNEIQVLSTDSLTFGAVIATLPIKGEDPRALAVSADGSKVFCAVFESGNATTVLAGGSTMNGIFPPNVVSDPTGPYAGQNPPFNVAGGFSPPLNPLLPAPPPVAHIVRKDASGQWTDDVGTDWTALVSGSSAALSGRIPGWDMPDRDLAVIDANTLTNSVTYARRLMNICATLSVNPANNRVYVVGTDATNEVRFEPNLKGTFIRVLGARVNIDGGGPGNHTVDGVTDLNPHLTYTASTIPVSQRRRSVGDPRAAEWNAAGDRCWIAGMGSNNVIVTAPNGVRALLSGPIEVGRGPTGIVLDEARDQAYVLNKFDATISVINTPTQSVSATVGFYDPTPAFINAGRELLYDTRATSGLGQASCASCHLDARTDRLGWDLGDPSGEMKSPADQNLGFGNAGQIVGFRDWHPMKGPMVTQTLQDIVGKEPHHWRGDRRGLEEFAPAFVGLLGSPAEPSAERMQSFEDFLSTVYFPPNPFRGLDNSLPTSLTLTEHYATGRFAGADGDPLPVSDTSNGLTLYLPPVVTTGGNLSCVNCHTLPTGAGSPMRWDISLSDWVALEPGALGEAHLGLNASDGFTNVTMKVPQLRNMHEKTGFYLTQPESRAGFGYVHDGSVDTLERFLTEPSFDLGSDQGVSDIVGFMLALAGPGLPNADPANPTLLVPPGAESLSTHAGVGFQFTLDSSVPLTPADVQTLLTMVDLAETNQVGLIAKGLLGGATRGFAYRGSVDTGMGVVPFQWQVDQQGVFVPSTFLLLQGVPGSEITLTLVPKGTEDRLGLDRDGDGCFDWDESLAGTDPNDPSDCTCTTPVPSAVTGFTAQNTGPYAVQLNWTELASATEGYLIEQQSTGAFEAVIQTAAGTTEHLALSLQPGTSYTFRIRGKSCGGLGPATVFAIATPAVNYLGDIFVEAQATQIICLPVGSALPQAQVGRSLVRVHDSLGQPLAGVTVRGQWTGDYAISDAMSTTDGNGIATFLTTQFPPFALNTFTFEVQDITRLGYVYNSLLNLTTPPDTTVTGTGTCP